MKFRLRLLWIVLFVAAAVLWSRYIQRPVDLPSWHEFDYSSIARNFVVEGNDISYPRIDWRRAGPGFTEMELPLQPWVTAQLYRAFGMQEWLGRLIPFGATLLSLAVFGRLARMLLPDFMAWVAALFFAANRTTLFVASAMQPEAVMLLFYLLAVYLFLRWMEQQNWWMYGGAIVAFASAMLMKSPAAHLGIFFFLVAYQKYGIHLFKRWELWAFVAISFAPVVLWYSHAYGLWKTYHNSMGVSNEDHWIGMDVLRRPRVFLGLISIEVAFIFGLGGALAVALVWVKRLRQERAFKTGAFWLVSIAIYFLVIIRTSGQYWAWYYHIVAVPPVALLLATSALQLRGTGRSRIALLSGIAACAVMAVAFTVLGHHDWSKAPGVVQDLMTPSMSGLSAFVLAGVAVLCLAGILFVAGHDSAVRPAGVATTALLAGAIAVYFMVCGQLTRNTWSQFSIRSAEYECVGCFADKIPAGALIVSSGGICKDPAGRRLANDAPEMFYWLNRKGFSTCEGEQSIEELRSDAQRGARYFIARKESVRDQPLLEQSLMKTFPLLGECKTSWLFGLQEK